MLPLIQQKKWRKKWLSFVSQQKSYLYKNNYFIFLDRIGRQSFIPRWKQISE